MRIEQPQGEARFHPKRGKQVFEVRGIATDETFGKPIKPGIKRIS